MTVQELNLLLNVIVVVLLAGYGIWLRYVMRQQLQSKDTTIEALRTAIEVKEAEISRLQGEIAPTIATHYTTMRQYAEQVTEDFNKVHEQLSTVVARIQHSERLWPAVQAMLEAQGMKIVQTLLDEPLEPFFQQLAISSPSLPSLDTLKKFVTGCTDAQKRINKEVNKRNKVAESILNTLKA